MLTSGSESAIVNLDKEELFNSKLFVLQIIINARLTQLSQFSWRVTIQSLLLG